VAGPPSLEELYEDAPCGYLSLTPDGVVTRANRTFLRSLGVAPTEVVGRRRLHDLMTPGSRLYAETHWLPRLQLEGRVAEVPVDLVREDGSRLSVLLNTTRVAHDDGTPDEIRASVFDATDRRRYERELIAARDHERAARERLEQLQDLSTALGSTLGVDRVAAVIAEFVFRAVAPDACMVLHDGELVQDRVARYPAPTPGLSVDLPLAVGDLEIGSLVIVLPPGRELSPEEHGILSSCAAAGATALRRAHLYAEREHQAFHDPLTGLANRLMLTERLAFEIARARRSGERFVLALLGLDDFKLLNDARGHTTGDEVLREVGARLTATVREVDLVARLSGDEFAIVCSAGEDESDGDAVAERLAAALALPVSVGAGEIFVRAAIGVVVGGGGDDAEKLLGDADAAMIVAKRSTGQRVVRFDASMRRRSRERARIEDELRIALRDGHLRVHYQPIVCSEDRSLAAMEALVRWEHPQRGLISPATFVPVAESCGLIVDLGRYVLRAATAQLAAWRAAGLVDDHVSMTVNLSPQQLAEADLVSDVASALAASRLDRTPWVVGLELTESMLMQSADSSAAKLAELAALGVRLLLDDFGTGASSLARLRRFPVDTLKIDRAFVTGLGQDAEDEDEAIVTAIIALAGALDLDVVAEGVERPAQAQWLTEVGAAKLQGFLFARPLPPDRMFELLVQLRRGAELLHAAA
jgi:diguanylate cyclase (GGDEF)-like protein/PAS domain S-box-containing protein